MGFTPNGMGKNDKDKRKDKGKDTPWPAPTFPTFGMGNGPTPMELDNVNVGNGKGKSQGKGQQKLTPAQRKQLISEGRCFKCYQPGHTAKFCGKQVQGFPGQAVGVNPMANQAWAQQYGMMYPTMPMMPHFSHKVSQAGMGLNAAEVVDDTTQTTSG